MVQCIEKEIKILNIDLPQLIARIESLWWVRMGTRTVIHDVYYHNEQTTTESKKIRLRRKGSTDVVTMKMKGSYEHPRYKCRRESEEYITRTMWEQVCDQHGLQPWREKFKTRISFDLDDIVCDIDLYPGLPPLLEIEWESPQRIEHRIEMLNLQSYTTSNRGTKALFKRYQKSVLPVIR